jgi:hypothetical protein
MAGEEVENMPPKRLLTDEPPPALWGDYRRALHHKLADLRERE